MPIRPSRHSPDPSLSLGFSLAVPVGTDAIQRSVSHASASPARLELPDQETRPRKGTLLLRVRSAWALRFAAVARGDRPAVRWWTAHGRPAGSCYTRVFRTEEKTAFPTHASRSHGWRTAEGAVVTMVGGPFWSTRSGRCFIYRPPLGSQEPSDQKQAARSEWRMASWYVMWALKAHQQAAQ